MHKMLNNCHNQSNRRYDDTEKYWCWMTAMTHRTKARVLKSYNNLSVHTIALNNWAVLHYNVRKSKSGEMYIVKKCWSFWRKCACDSWASLAFWHKRRSSNTSIETVSADAEVAAADSWRWPLLFCEICACTFSEASRRIFIFKRANLELFYSEWGNKIVPETHTPLLLGSLKLSPEAPQHSRR